MMCLACLKSTQLSMLAPSREMIPPILLRLRLLHRLTPVMAQIFNNQEPIRYPHRLFHLATNKQAIRKLLPTTALLSPVMVQMSNQEPIRRHPHLQLMLVLSHTAIRKVLPILVRLSPPPQHSDRIVVDSGSSWALS